MKYVVIISLLLNQLSYAAERKSESSKQSMVSSQGMLFTTAALSGAALANQTYGSGQVYLARLRNLKQNTVSSLSARGQQARLAVGLSDIDNGVAALQQAKLKADSAKLAQVSNENSLRAKTAKRTSLLLVGSAISSIAAIQLKAEESAAGVDD